MKRSVVTGLAFLLLLVSCMPAAALVVGREGVTYPIRERDMLEVIKERLSGVDLDTLEKETQAALREQVKVFRLKDSVSDLPPADKERQYRVDLTYTVPQDIKDLHGNIIYPEGHKVNPLKVLADQGISYPIMLLIINGEREAELQWFQQSQFDNPRVKVLITDGYPYQLADRLKRPVFQLTEIIKERFRIEATPSLVYWPLKSEYLAVRTIVVPEPDPVDETVEEPAENDATTQ